METTGDSDHSALAFTLIAEKVQQLRPRTALAIVIHEGWNFSIKRSFQLLRSGNFIGCRLRRRGGGPAPSWVTSQFSSDLCQKRLVAPQLQVPPISLLRNLISKTLATAEMLIRRLSCGFPRVSAYECCLATNATMGLPVDIPWVSSSFQSSLHGEGLPLCDHSWSDTSQVSATRTVLSTLPRRMPESSPSKYVRNTI